MSAERFYAAQSGHPLPLLAPIDVTGGKASKAFNFSKYTHASITVAIGVSAAAPTAILLEACTAQDGTGATAIGFDYFACETSDTDVLAAKQTATAAGITPSANDDIFYQIEIDSNVIPAGSSYLRVHITNGSNSVIAAVFAVLSGARYAQDQSPTVLA